VRRKYRAHEDLRTAEKSTMSRDNTSLVAAAGATAAAVIGGFAYYFSKRCDSCYSGKPKLTYFNGRGLAEVTRLIFAEANVEYEDVRVSDIKDLKSGLPWGQVPVYEEGDFKLAQSTAIARYVARKHGMYGKNAREAALIDSVVDAISDVRSKYIAVRNASEDKKEAEKAKFANETLPQWLGFFEKWLKANGGEYFVGNSISLADFMVFNSLANQKNEFANAFSDCPNLLSFLDKVASRPRVAKWIKARPVSEF